MKISTRTEYGIRVLVTLARSEGEDRCLSLAEIAKREKLPHAYLEQLAGDLRRAGLVTATRGQSGGYRLARPAAEIAMADAIRALEGRSSRCRAPASVTSSTAIGPSRAASTRSSSASTNRSPCRSARQPGRGAGHGRRAALPDRGASPAHRHDRRTHATQETPTA